MAELDWETYFADEHLDELLSQALAGSFDVQLALQRIEIARAGVLGTEGALLPKVTLAANGGVQRFGLFTMDGAGNASTDIRPGEVVPRDYPELGIGLVASWEPDLWGRLRDLRDSARAGYLATIEGTNLVVSTLIADVAAAYFQLVASDQVLEILERTLLRQTEALELMRAMKEAAQATELAVQQFEAQVAGTRAMIAEVEGGRTALENQINLLLGRPPQPVSRTRDALERRFGAGHSAGAPSELLRNRPDIREAEQMVQAAELDLEAARAAFYPQLQITGSTGYDAYQTEFLFMPDSFAYSIASTLLIPLFNRAELEAGQRLAAASRMRALIEYQAVVLRAFVEVSNALVAIDRAAAAVEQLELKRAALERSVVAADSLFLGGMVSYLDVLVAQQGALEADLDLVQGRLEQRLAGVRLYKALGGGWRARSEWGQSG